MVAPTVREQVAEPAEPVERRKGGGAEGDEKARRCGRVEFHPVATEKVDRLIDLVGELVIAQVMTAQMVEH